MRFGRNKPNENLKRVEGKVTHIAPIYSTEALRRIVSVSVTLKHKVLSKTYTSESEHIAQTVFNFLDVGMQVYLTLDEQGDIVGCGVITIE